MNKNHPLFVPFLLFLAGFLLRLALISKGPYHLDCFDLAMKSQATLETLRLHYLYGSGYPFAVVLGAFFILILKPFGITDPVTAVNFMSVVSGALCVPALYLVGKKLLNEKTALFAAVMFSVLPVFLGVSVYGKNHAPAILLLLMTVYYFLLYEESGKRHYLLFSAVAAGLLGATRIQDLALMVPALCFLFFRQAGGNVWKTRLKDIVIFGGITGFIVAVLHLPLLLSGEHYGSQMGEFWQRGLIKNFLGFNEASLSWTIFLTERNFTWGGLLVALIGLALIARENRKVFFFLILWFFLPLAFYANLSSTVERFLIISYVPLVLGQGFLFERLLRLGRVLKVTAVSFFLFIMGLLVLDIFPVLWTRHQHDYLTGFARWVGEKTPPDAVIITGDETVIVRHYARRETIPQLISILDPITEEQFARYKQTVDDLLNKGSPVYITDLGLWSNNPDMAFRDFLERNYALVLVGKETFEDWHQGETFQMIYPVHLFRIYIKD